MIPTLIISYLLVIDSKHLKWFYDGYIVHKLFEKQKYHEDVIIIGWFYVCRCNHLIYYITPIDFISVFTYMINCLEDFVIYL